MARTFQRDGRSFAASDLPPAADEPLPVYTVAQVRQRFFPGRCARWIKEQFRTGEFGAVFFDGACWFISADAVKGWQRAHKVEPVNPPGFSV